MENVTKEMETFFNLVTVQKKPQRFDFLFFEKNKYEKLQ